MKQRKGFTLVELLVVIGIIALLIGILLPALNRARQQAQLIQCQSNIRQIIAADLLFAQDHKGCVPTCSDTKWAQQADTVPTTKFAYRDSSPNPATPSFNYVVLDWASSLIPYLGQGNAGQNNNNFLNTANAQQQSKVYQCPSDVWLSDSTPGYAMMNNVLQQNIVSPDTYSYQPVSYGINADITMVIDNGGNGRFVPPAADFVDVYAGPLSPGKLGQPLNCRLDRVYKSAETLLVADCGTRPYSGGSPTGLGLDENTCLYFTTNNAKSIPPTIPPNPLKGPGGRLINILNGSGAGNAWGSNIPIAKNAHNPAKVDRHIGGVINIGFCDGHVESLGLGDFVKVRISPYRY